MSGVDVAPVDGELGGAVVAEPGVDVAAVDAILVTDEKVRTGEDIRRELSAAGFVISSKDAGGAVKVPGDDAVVPVVPEVVVPDIPSSERIAVVQDQLREETKRRSRMAAKLGKV